MKIKTVVSSEFDYNLEYINTNVNMAQTKLGLAINLIEQVMYAAKYASKNDINILSSVYDDDIVDCLEDITGQLKDVESLIGA
jgi:sialic acid synthase SpsE